MWWGWVWESGKQWSPSLWWTSHLVKVYKWKKWMWEETRVGMMDSFNSLSPLQHSSLWVLTIIFPCKSSFMPMRVYAIIIGLYSVQQSVLQEGYRKGGKEGRREKEREREMKREQERFSVISMLSHGLKKTIGKLLVCIFFPDTKAIYAYCT